MEAPGVADPEEAGAAHLGGGRRLGLVGANPITCQIFAFGGDGLLRLYNPKAAGSLRCSCRLQPFLLDTHRLRANQRFWEASRTEQERLVEQWGSRELPFDVEEIRLPSTAATTDYGAGVELVALIGKSSVAVATVPPLASTQFIRHKESANDGAKQVTEMLSRLGLEGYAEEFDAQGYDNVAALHAMSLDERGALYERVSLKPGHAMALSQYLDGRLPSVPPATPAAETAAECVKCWTLMLPPSALCEPLNASAARARAGGNNLWGRRLLPAATSAFCTPRPDSVAGHGSRAGPAMLILQVEWHPLSSTHLAILTSHSTFFLFDAANDLTTPELAMAVPTDVDDGAVAFCFGAFGCRGWGSLTLYLACADGAIFAACPVLPASSSAQQHLRGLAPQLLKLGCSASTRRWLQLGATTPTPPPSDGFPGAPSSSSQWHSGVAGTAIAEWRPLLQGPFAVLDGAGRLATGEADSRLLAVCSTPLRSGASLLALGLSNHSVLLVLVTEPLQPRFADDDSAASGRDPDGFGSRHGGLELLLISIANCSPDTAQPTPCTPPSSHRRASAPMGLVTPQSRHLSRLTQTPPSRSAAAGDSETPSTPRALRKMQLLSDPLRSTRVYVHTTAGAFLVSFPWMDSWDDFLFADLQAAGDPSRAGAPPPPPLPPRSLRAVCLLASTTAAADGRGDFGGSLDAVRTGASVVGFVPLYDPCLGEALFAMTAKGKWLRLQLEAVAAAEAEMLTKLVQASRNAAHYGACAADIGAVELHELQLRDLAHWQVPKQKAKSLAVLPEQLRSQLSSASGPTEASFASFAKALDALGSSAGMHCVRVSAQTDQRLRRLEEFKLPQEDLPDQQGVAADVVEALKAVMQKAKYCAVLQANLEQRASLLRDVLRSDPGRFEGVIALEQPKAEEDEEAQDAEQRMLRSLRHRVHALRGTTSAIRVAVDTEDSAAALTSGAVARVSEMPPGIHLTDPGAFISGDATNQLKAQGKQVEQLVEMLKDSQLMGEDALCVAECTARGRS